MDLRPYFLFACVLLCPLSVIAQNEEPVIDDAVRQWSAKVTQEHRMKAAGNDHIKIFPGVFADRAKRQVELLAVATGVDGVGPVEFFLVSETGKAYESLAVTTGKPSDINAALEFIGLPKGRPIDYQNYHFWPRGERVMLNVDCTPRESEKAVTVPIEHLVINRKAKAPMPATGLVFVGSSYSKDDNGNPRYDADILGDVASNYNDPWSVMDTPARVDQASNYGSIIANPEKLLPRGQRMTVTITPEYPADRKRVLDVNCKVANPPGGNAATAAELQLTLTSDGAEPLACDYTGLLKTLEQHIRDGRDAFVSITFATDVTVKLAGEFCSFLNVIADRNLIRVEPDAGRPYYQAFIPSERWRERMSRPTQPIEIYVTAGAPQWKGKIVDIGEEYTDEGRKLSPAEKPYGSLEDLTELLRAKRETDTVFVFAEADLPYGDIITIHKLIAERFPTLYVYLPKAEAAPQK